MCIGTVSGHEYENKYCPRCGRPLIRRIGFDIVELNLTEDMRCPYGGYKINIAGKIHPTYKIDHFVYIPLETLRSVGKPPKLAKL